MLGILGSGFGLYGYLPAAVSAGYDKVILPIRYRSKFQNRYELEQYLPKVVWKESDDIVCNSASSLIYSKRPIDQFAVAKELLTKPQLHRIIFEKPLAPNPRNAIDLLNLISNSSKNCSIGFILRYTPWAKAFLELLRNSSNNHQEIWKITWHFTAHHFRYGLSSWKDDHEQGGGVLRFYGIQFIALLSSWGFTETCISEIDVSKDRPGYSLWRAVFRGWGLPEVRLEIDCYSSDSSFSIRNIYSNFDLHHSPDIFDLGRNRLVDARCEYLKELILETNTTKSEQLSSLMKINSLWLQAEHNTVFLEV